MPIVILLDNSLSMGQKIELADGSTSSRLTIALSAIQTFVSHHATNNKLNPAALLVFSSQCETICNLTRDFEALLNSLKTITLSDQTNLFEALSFIKKLVAEEWGTDHEYDILIVTDGNSCVNSNHRSQVPFCFQSRMHIICITTTADIAFQRSIPFYQTLISGDAEKSKEIKLNTAYKKGQIYVPTSKKLSFLEMEQIMFNICQNYFKPCIARMNCGELTSNVNIYPNLQHQDCKQDEPVCIEICGFFDYDELANAPAHSKHLVLPMKESLDKMKRMFAFIDVKNDLSDADLEEMFQDERKQPSFAVLLNGSAKVSNTMALVQIGTDCSQYGLLFSKTDAKKRSHLMLNTFEPGVTSALWIPNFNNLGFSNSTTLKPNLAKKSSNIMVWVDQDSMQSDVQKILRYARKLPEKYELLLSEIRKVKRAAFAFDFHELLQTLIELLEREAASSNNAHPEASAYIANIIKELRTANV